MRFCERHPARAIGTLVVFATTLGLVLLSPPELDAQGAAGTVTVTGLTDSQVSAAVVTRGLIMAFPLWAVAMELSAQWEARGTGSLLNGFPRDLNKEAAALADGRWAGFNQTLRAQADFRRVRWLVLDDLLAAGSRFFRDAAAAEPRR